MRGGYGGSYRGYDDGGADPLASAIQNALSVGLSVSRERRARKLDDDDRRARQEDRDTDNRRQQQAVDEQKRRDLAIEDRQRRAEEREQGTKLADAGYAFVPTGIGGGQALVRGKPKSQRDAELADTITSALAGKHALEKAAARGLTLPANATGAQAIEALRVADQQETARVKADEEKFKAGVDVQTHAANRSYDVAHPLKDPNALPIKRVPATVGAAYIANTVQRSKIDDAIAKAEANPEAFGFHARLPADVLNRKEGKGYAGGVDARSAIADIGSQIIHDRSGAAVTVSEFPRLKPFIPLATDPPAKILSNLRRIQQYIDEESTAMQSLYGEDQGYAPLPGRGKPVAVTAPRTRPRTGDVIR